MVVLNSFLAPQEGVRHEEQNTTLYINEREIGSGTLYITESVLSWVNCTTQEGFSLEYPHISLHAVSRDENAHPRKCLYVMVNDKIHFPDAPPVSTNNDSENEDDDDENEDTAITEMRFAPENVNNLDAMFQAMNYCQSLHPDPEDSFSDAEEDIYEDAEGDDAQYYEVGSGDGAYIGTNENADHNVSNDSNTADEAMDVETGQFEDAEEEP